MQSGNWLAAAGDGRCGVCFARRRNNGGSAGPRRRRVRELRRLVVGLRAGSTGGRAARGHPLQRKLRAEKRRNGAWASLRCASASGRVELRATLSASGSRVSGSWEERSYGLGGQVSGTASGNSLRLTFSGGLSGSMTVTTTGGSQSISVRTDISALQGVSVNLRRN